MQSCSDGDIQQKLIINETFDYNILVLNGEDGDYYHRWDLRLKPAFKGKEIFGTITDLQVNCCVSEKLSPKELNWRNICEEVARTITAKAFINRLPLLNNFRKKRYKKYDLMGDQNAELEWQYAGLARMR